MLLKRFESSAPRVEKCIRASLRLPFSQSGGTGCGADRLLLQVGLGHRHRRSIDGQDIQRSRGAESAAGDAMVPAPTAICILNGIEVAGHGAVPLRPVGSALLEKA